MNKIVIIVLAFLIVFLVALKLVIPSVKDNPKELELTYKISAGIPFKWEYEIEDESIVGFVKSYVVRDDNKGGKVGASVYTDYVFKGLKEGTTTIIFRTVSITGEYPDSNIEKNIVRVDKNLNVTLVKKQ